MPYIVRMGLKSMLPTLKLESGHDALKHWQNGRHFADNILKWVFRNENIWISLRILLNFVSKVSVNSIPAMVQIMAWHRPGDKSLSEPMMVSLLMHICVTRPQWVKVVITGSKEVVIMTTYVSACCDDKVGIMTTFRVFSCLFLDGMYYGMALSIYPSVCLSVHQLCMQ